MYGDKIKAIASALLFLFASVMPLLTHSSTSDYNVKMGCMSCHQSNLSQNNLTAKKKLDNLPQKPLPK